MTAYTADMNGSLILGAGTSYPWAEFPEGFGTPPVRTQDVERVDRDGVYAGADRLNARLVVFDVHIIGTNAQDTETKLLTLKAFFARSDENVDIGVNITSVVQYTLIGRPRGCDVVLSNKIRQGVARARCMFLAVDPRLYSSTSNSTQINMASGGSGLTFNASADFSFGGAVAGGEAILINVGTYPSPFVATFTGPLTNPSLEHSELGLTLAFTGDIAVGETLVVDTDVKTVLLNGTSSRYTWLTTSSRWFDLTTGDNSLRLLAGAGSGFVTIAWRSAYV